MVLASLCGIGCHTCTSVAAALPHQRLGFAHSAVSNHIGFTDSFPLSDGLINGRPGLDPQGFKMAIAPAFIHPRRNYISPLYQTKLLMNPHLYKPRNSEKFKMPQPHINDNISNSSNITNSNNNVWNKVNCTMVDEKSEILAWLSPLEPQIRHHDIQTRRVDKVGDWLIQTEEYQNWFGGIRGDNPDCSALFCYGGPGVGKTYIR